MPLIKSSYIPSFLFKNAHYNTIYRTFFMDEEVKFNRERLELEDSDFLDLDISSVNSKTVVIALHGLEGSSQSKYILTATKEFNKENIDVIAVNLRGCSGEQNRLLPTYHSGKTDDLDTVIKHVDKKHDYTEIILLGYSLGGNITLKYIGEKQGAISSKIKCAIAISVPCDLTSSSSALSQLRNMPYMAKFMQTLKLKALEKLEKFPDSGLDKKTINAAKNFYDFDTLFTAPINGFLNAEDYWEKCSSKPFLNEIKIPTLLLNALDDTFLSKECFPIEIASRHKFLHLETPKYGGHVGFNSKLIDKKGYWLERRLYDFIKEYIE